jgi:hypothetical protein
MKPAAKSLRGMPPLVADVVTIRCSRKGRHGR